MNYTTEYIASTLKATREGKGLSQRELSRKSGVLQGQISKIENGAVDLRLSSLVALARALDLELILVPRKAVSAVKSIIQSSARNTPKHDQDSRRALKELKRLQDTINSFMEKKLFPKELAQLQHQVRALQQIPLSSSAIEPLRVLNRAFTSDATTSDAIHHALSTLQSLRNALANSANVPQIESARPAYSLDEDDHG